MKKILLIALLSMVCLGTKAQSIYFTNTTNCDVWVWIVASNGACSGINGLHASISYRIPAGTSTPVEYDMFSGGTGTLISWQLSWSPTIGISTLNSSKFFDHDHSNTTCATHMAGGTGSTCSCIYDGNIVGDGSCYGSPSCIEVSNSEASAGCISGSGCAVGSCITGTWTNLGGGNAELDFN